MAVIEDLRARGHNDLLYVGSEDGPEKIIMEKNRVEYKAVKCGKLRRYFSVKNFFDIFKVIKGVGQAKKILKEFKPERVFSKGGFISVPVVVAAYRLKIPVIVHESDLSPGLANKVGMRIAKKVCVSFDESIDYLTDVQKDEIVVTGNPIRKSLLEGDAKAGLNFTKCDEYRPVILVMGGSQGAASINTLVRESLDELLKRYQIVHLVGRGNIDIALKKKGYVQYEYLDESMKNVYAMAEVVVSRGGANSLAEIAILKKKAVIIPLSKKISRGDQEENAALYKKKMGWSVLSDEVKRDEFISTLEAVASSSLKPEGNVENGTKKIVDVILSEV